MIHFWSFIFRESYIYYRGYLKLNFYIAKKVQKNFLMGLKIWGSWGSEKMSKSKQVGQFLIFHAKLQNLSAGRVLFLSKKTKTVCVFFFKFLVLNRCTYRCTTLMEWHCILVKAVLQHHILIVIQNRNLKAGRYVTPQNDNTKNQTNQTKLHIPPPRSFRNRILYIV